MRNKTARSRPVFVLATVSTFCLIVRGDLASEAIRQFCVHQGPSGRHRSYHGCRAGSKGQQGSNHDAQHGGHLACKSRGNRAWMPGAAREL